jgi:predicted PurR-regulated permease PerM
MFALMSLVFAITLNPTVIWLEHYRLPRWIAVLLVGIALTAILCVIVAFVVPPLASQITSLANNLPVMHARAIERLPPTSQVGRQIIDMVFKIPSSPEFVQTFSQPLTWGRATVSGVTSVLLVCVTTLYLLADGRRVFAWIIVYVPRGHRAAVAATLGSMAELTHAYFRGQLIVSTLFGVFAGIVLAILRVPNPLALAILAAFCDVIPLVGILLALVPAALIAFIVSPVAALTVVVAFLLYHWTEAYWIAPRTFGATLRLPALAVVLGLVLGYAIMGILGAIFVLPLLAAYPIIEKEWLSGYLGPDVLSDHFALARMSKSMANHAVDEILRGDSPTDESHPS